MLICLSTVPGDCDSDEYSCRNGRCISDNLVCNGNNPCGDYSDCAYVIAAGVIAGIVVGTVALVVTVVTVVVIICRRRRVAYVSCTIVTYTLFLSMHKYSRLFTKFLQ